MAFARCLSDTEGHYHFDYLAPGSYELHVVHRSHPLQSSSIAIDGTMDVEQDVWLEPGESISGFVVDPSGNPLEGVQIWANIGHRRGTLLNDLGISHIVTTDASGLFSVGPFESGREGTLFVSMGGAKTVKRNVVAGAHDIELVLTTTRAFRGRVVDAVDGRPVKRFWREKDPPDDSRPGLPASRSRRPCSDAAGRFEIELAPGTRIRAGSESHLTSDWVDPSPLPELVFRLAPGDSIHGHLLDDSGKPVSGLEVFVRPDGDERRVELVRTDSQGRYRFGVGAGVWLIGAGSYESSAIDLVRVQVADGDSVRQDLTLPPPVQLEIHITGGDRRPVSGATVNALLTGTHQTYAGVTDAQGRVTLEVVPGQYLVWGGIDKSYTRQKLQEVTGGATRLVELQLE
jgi:hypothetical protein